MGAIGWKPLYNVNTHVPGSKPLILVMVIPLLIGNPYNGYINPLLSAWWPSPNGTNGGWSTRPRKSTIRSTKDSKAAWVVQVHFSQDMFQIPQGRVEKKNTLVALENQNRIFVLTWCESNVWQGDTGKYTSQSLNWHHIIFHRENSNTTCWGGTIHSARIRLIWC